MWLILYIYVRPGISNPWKSLNNWKKIISLIYRLEVFYYLSLMNEINECMILVNQIAIAENTKDDLIFFPFIQLLCMHTNLLNKNLMSLTWSKSFWCPDKKWNYFDQNTELAHLPQNDIIGESRSIQLKMQENSKQIIWMTQPKNKNNWQGTELVNTFNH